MNVAKKIWAWVLENPWALLVAIAGVFGAFLIYKRKDNKIANLEDAVVVQATKRKIAAVEAKAEVLKKQADEQAPKVQELDKLVAESKRRVMEIHEERKLEDMSDEEVARLFSSTRL
jgi:hypothetical protein